MSTLERANTSSSKLKEHRSQNMFSTRQKLRKQPSYKVKKPHHIKKSYKSIKIRKNSLRKKHKKRKKVKVKSQYDSEFEQRIEEIENNITKLQTTNQ